MIPVYVQLRIGSRIFFHNRSWGFATKQGSVCDRAAQPRMLGRDLCWEFSGGRLIGKDWQWEKGKAFCSGISEFLLARCALQSFLIEGSLGGCAKFLFSMHPPSFIGVYRWLVGAEAAQRMEAIREQEEFLSTQAEEIWESKFRKGPGQWSWDFEWKVSKQTNHLVFAKVQERVILESDFVRGFRPVDPERILLGDVTRDVG